MDALIGGGEVNLTLELNEAAPTELQTLGATYWDLAGIDEYTNALIWRVQTNQLGFEIWAGTAHYAAAAAAVATAQDYVCSSCDGPLTLTSRQALSDAINGKGVKCRRCNGTIDDRAVKVLFAGEKEQREKHAAEAAARRDERQAQLQKQAETHVHAATLEVDRREAIATQYPVESSGATEIIVGASLLARVGALSILHAFGDNSGLIFPLDYANETLAPASQFGRELFLAAFHQGLLLVHPSTQTDAFVWQDGAADLKESIYTARVRFYVPGDGSLPERLDVFANVLRASLALGPMWSTQRGELEALGHRIVAEEAARYLVRELQEHNLPDLTETHEEALRTHATRGAALFPLGHLYRMAWSSARDASSAYQRNKGMSKEKAVTYGLNQFERWIQRAADQPSLLNEPFKESKDRLPLAAVTGVVYRTILGLDPMIAGPEDVAKALSSSPDDELMQKCDEAIPERHELIEWVRTTTTNWDGEDIRRILARLEDWEPQLCAPNCAHDRVGHVAREAGRVFDRVVARVGASDALILTAEATGVANAMRDGVRTGDALLAEVVRHLKAL